MRLLLDLFLAICLLRKGPQDVPVSEVLMRLTIALYLALGLVVGLLELALPLAIAQTVLELGLMIAITYALLRLRGLAQRFQQTVTALAGTGALVGVVALPVITWLLHAHQQETDATIPSLLYLALLVWRVVVIGHILRHALAVQALVGNALAMGYLVVTIVALGWLFPVR